MNSKLVSDASIVAIPRAFHSLRREHEWLVASLKTRGFIKLSGNFIKVFAALAGPRTFKTLADSCQAQAGIDGCQLLEIVQELYLHGVLEIDHRSIQEASTRVGSAAAACSPLPANALSICWESKEAELPPGVSFVWDPASPVAPELLGNASSVFLDLCQPFWLERAEGLWALGQLLQQTCSRLQVLIPGAVLGDCRPELLRHSQLEAVFPMQETPKSSYAEQLEKLKPYLEQQIACFPLGLVERRGQAAAFSQACREAGFNSWGLDFLGTSEPLSKEQQVNLAEELLALLDEVRAQHADWEPRVNITRPRIMPLERLLGDLVYGCSPLGWEEEGVLRLKLTASWADKGSSRVKLALSERTGGVRPAPMRCRRCFFSGWCGQAQGFASQSILRSDYAPGQPGGRGLLCAFWRTLGEGLLWRIQDDPFWRDTSLPYRIP